jgi:protein TonB
MSKVAENTDDSDPTGSTDSLESVDELGSIDELASMDELASIDSFVLPSRPLPDRLPPMLFLAALVHGILIIGITFNAIVGDAFSEAISLEVTIVADPERNVLEPESADYLAQASQEGSGTTSEQTRPGARAESPVPVDNNGDEFGEAANEATFLDEVSDQVLTSKTDQDLNVLDKPREDPTPDESTAAAMEAGLALSLPLPREDVVNLAIHDDTPRELVTSVNTRESKIAPYLDRWKRKIEAIGVRYLPDQSLLNGMTGSPTLEVIISASGQLQEVIVRRTSGSKILDQAALDILRRAAPFDPFPEAVRADYDTLRFAYKWQFNRSDVQSTASNL